MTFATLLAVPHIAPAAVKTWTVLNAAPATTNITAGTATNVTTTLTWTSGSGASARFAGPALLSVSLSPAEPTITVSLSQTNFTFPTPNTTFNPTLTFATTALTPSNTYTVTIIGNTNPPTFSDPDIKPVTNTFTVTMATGAPFNPVKVWTNGGVNGNWTTAGNWTPNGAPGSSNDVRFSDVGTVGTVGAVNNTVDASFNIGSLAYRQTNNYHTTAISSGTTLSVTGTNGLAAGTDTDPGDSIVPVTTVTNAGGSLVVSNSSALVNIGQAHATGANAVSQSRATLDLSGLDSFTATASRLLVGVDLTIKGSAGVLNLARTNKITLSGATAPQLDVGDNSQSGGTPTIPSILLLGQTNAIFADSITVGRGKTDLNGASMYFNSSFANPVAFFRGTNGNTSRVTSWAIADGATARTYWTYGTNDFSLGTVDARVDSMVIGKGAVASSPNPGTGFLIFNAGTIDVNTLAVGYSQDGIGTGTVNANGGSLVVNTNLELAHGATAVGTLNISSATVTANNGIVNGGGTATITMNGGTLNVTNVGTSMGTSGSPITTLAVTNATLKLAVQNGTPSSVVGTLSCDGANTISISAVPVLISLPAQFPVIQYTTSDGNLAGFALGTLPAGSPAYAGYISNNTANSTLDLVITNGPVVAPLVWHGQVNSSWDTTTANWKTNGVATTYQQGYPVVRFDDTLTGTNFASLTTTLTPGSLTVDNSATDYTFGGAGKISGSTGLTKTGSRKLTLIQSGGDDYTGDTKINNGTLQVGNGGTSGTLSSAKVSVDAPATLVFNRSDNLTVASVISGLGTVTQTGASIAALSGSNSTFAGQFIVANGTLQPGNIVALGSAAASVIVSNSATLDVNGQKFNNNQAITVSGAGVAGNGAIVNNSTNSPNQILRNVTLTGNTTFGGFSDWDIHSSANPASDATLSTVGNNYKLTKVGTNTVTIFGAQVDGSLGDIDIQAGTLSFERNTTSMGDPGKTVTVFTNATLQFQNPSNIWNKVVVLKDGATIRGINLAEFAGPVTLESGVAIALAGTGAKLILDSAVGGAGGLIKNGGGSLTLASASTYTGPTLVSQGAIVLINSGSIDSSTNITLGAGAILDLSALASPALTVTSGRGLGGSGTVVGDVTMATGSTLTVGGTGTNSLGTLTVTNSLLLQAGSTTLMEVSKTGGVTNNDQVVTTNVTYGGTVTVTGTGGAFVAGDTFKLFAAGTYGGSFSTINLPTNVVWNTTQLGANGTIQVVSVSSPNITGGLNTSTNFQVSFSGPAGNNYRVWASTNVAATPITNTWTVIASGLINGTGSATIADNTATNYPVRFYLISVP